MSPELVHVAAAIGWAYAHEPALSVTLPLHLENATNEHAHWRARQKRAKAQRTVVALGLGGKLRGLRCGTERLVVLVTRIAPCRLDDDGAVAAAKTVRDQVARLLFGGRIGAQDSHERVTWLPVDQERAGVREYACRVEVWRWER